MSKTAERKEKRKMNKEFQQAQLEEERKRRDLLARAKAVQDVFVDFAPFRKFDRNGLDLVLEYRTEIVSDPKLLDWTFNLLKENMAEIYDKVGFTGGWNDKKEKRILREDECRYIFAFQKETKEPVAFVHLRFDEEDDREVLYCYELQVSSSVRGKGLGKFLMQILELVARKYFMRWIMLTVIKENEGAMRFYKEKMKYVVDEFDPSEEDRDVCYEILSKSLPLR
eukprot:TRINITY_DN10002_c0_g1_i1.p1 TRINITY_DN10002_c0_g1~~TRINITY_DN10002_c0_g1_i1.p1  ORF type:complete len:225 (-),score=69.13 TRINITY_DN10002_c0_g1_i1:15-689(-)